MCLTKLKWSDRGGRGCLSVRLKDMDTCLHSPLALLVKKTPQDRSRFNSFNLLATQSGFRIPNSSTAGRP